MKGITDMVGKTFGWLTVMDEAGRDEYGNIVWTCRCECGVVCEARGFALRRGEKKDCGAHRSAHRRRSAKPAPAIGNVAQGVIDDFLYRRPPPVAREWVSRFTGC